MELFLGAGIRVMPINTIITRSHNLSVSPFHLPFPHSRFSASLTKSSYQDFQDYAKPRRVLPTKQLREEPPDKIISALESSDGSSSLYKVLLCTSSSYGSGLSNQNAGILVCIIDEQGDSILERIPAFHFQHYLIRFQTGSKDDFFFWGPKLATIRAIWISLDSGTWRLGGASLTIISAHNHQGEETETSANAATMYQSTTYNFKVDDDVLLGEGSDLSMVELRPCLVTHHHGADTISIIDQSDIQAGSFAEKEMAKEESLREYANLKYSLLLYDSILIFAGTSIASIAGGENTALAFLTGGVGGFLYLLLLQRSVDTLPAPESNVTSTGTGFNSLFRGVKGPVVVFALAFLLLVLATKFDTPDVIAALSPRDILAGMLGFLACKISVVLAAFKPVSVSKGFKTK